MDWYPLARTIPQYVDLNGDPYSGAVLKAYEAGTSTPADFATDNTGGTTVGSIALNASGYPEVSGNEVIPHMDQNFKLSLYPTQAAADADTGALWTYDNIIYTEATATPASSVYVDSVYGMIDTAAQTTGIPVIVGDFYSTVKGGGGVFYWDSAQNKANANGGTIIDPGTLGGWTGSASNIGTTYYGGSGQGTGSGTGCWARSNVDVYYTNYFGAAANGVTTDDAPVINAIVTALPAGGILDGSGDSFRVDSSVTLKTDMEIRAIDLDFSNAGADDLFEATGTLATAINLTANGTAGAQTLTMGDTSTLTSGKYILLSSTDLWKTTANTATQGEWHRIKAVDSSTVITLEDVLIQTYNTADTAKIQVATTIKNLTLANITATGDNSSAQSAGVLTYTENLNIINCVTDKFFTRHWNIAGGIKFMVDNVKATRSASTGLGYGISIGKGSQWGTVRHSHFEDMRHGVTIGGTEGVNRFITVDGNKIYGARGAGIDCHPATQYFDFINNFIQGGASAANEDGIIAQGCDGKITGNTILRCARHGILWQQFPDDVNQLTSIHIQDNNINQPGEDGIRVVTPGAAVCNSVIISGNHVDNPGEEGITVSASVGDVRNISIANNVVRNVTGASFRSLHIDVADGLSFNGGTITGNSFVRGDDATENIRLSADTANEIGNITVTGNFLRNGTFAVLESNGTGIGVFCNTIVSVATGDTSGAGITAANNV